MAQRYGCFGMAMAAVTLLCACGQSQPVTPPVDQTVGVAPPTGPSLSDVASGLTRGGEIHPEDVLADLDPAIHGAYALSPMTKGAFERLDAAWEAYDITAESGPIYEAFAEWFQLAQALERGEGLANEADGVAPKRAVQMVAASCAAIAMTRLSGAEPDERNELRRLAEDYLSHARYVLSEPYAVKARTLNEADLYVAHRAMLAELQDLSPAQAATMNKLWVTCENTAANPLFSQTGEAFNLRQPRNQVEDLLDRSVPLGR